jgi:hypothetical protein
MAKALVLYRSLVEQVESFTLYYYCFDETTFRTLQRLKTVDELYGSLIPVPIKDLMDPILVEAKSNRTEQEFFFTLTPFVVYHAINTHDLSQCTYLDADIRFFNNPAPLFDEMQDKSVLITRHNYSKGLEHLEYAGIYCVQFNPFRNDVAGMKVLSWWKEKCAEWCYLRKEDGKWGDQGYLNSWPEMFESVAVSKHSGAGVAPWNVDAFDVLSSSDYKLVEKNSQREFDIIFYHFQGVKQFFGRFFFIGSGRQSEKIKRKLYRPYFRELRKVKAQLKALDPKLEPIGNSDTFADLIVLLKHIRRRKIM